MTTDSKVKRSKSWPADVTWPSPNACLLDKRPRKLQSPCMQAIHFKNKWEGPGYSRCNSEASSYVNDNAIPMWLALQAPKAQYNKVTVAGCTTGGRAIYKSLNGGSLNVNCSCLFVESQCRSQYSQRLRFKVMRIRSQVKRPQGQDKHRYYGSIGKQPVCNGFDECSCVWRITHRLFVWWQCLISNVVILCSYCWSALRTNYIKRAALNDIFDMRMKV